MSKQPVALCALLLACHSQRPAASAESDTVEGLAAQAPSPAAAPRPAAAHPNELRLPNGSTAYGWACVWPIQCMQIAGDMCSRGYVVHAVEDAAPAIVSGDAVSRANASRYVWCTLASMGGDPQAAERCGTRVDVDIARQTAQQQREADRASLQLKQFVFSCRKPGSADAPSPGETRQPPRNG
jgi:hypothetical protein